MASAGLDGSPAPPAGGGRSDTAHPAPAAGRPDLLTLVVPLLAAAPVMALGGSRPLRALCLGALTALAALLLVRGAGRFPLPFAVREAAPTAGETAALAEVERLREEHRRLRRDLHDLVGYSLSAVVVRAEVLRRGIPREHGAARSQAAELITLGRRAIAEIRAVSAGSQELSLSRDLPAACRILEAAGITAELDGPAPDGVAPRVEAALAAVLREGTTNVLRHSAARHCRITVRRSAGQLGLHLANDGFPEADPTGTGGTGGVDGTNGMDGMDGIGTGLASLADRVAAAGGTLTWSHSENWFHLCAVCPDPEPGLDPAV
ncbi:sensor histidine kinase [Streptomyces sp. NPDC001595]|uniref:sensor histidine kinase n=1 Tax=Streptomyces sp. NPDC001532 TaxID=3154520 RepID=UPI003331726C